MALHPIDRELLDRCLNRQPGSWEAFVDRYLGLVLHVVGHSAQSRGMTLTPQDREDLTSEVFHAFLADDMAVLRRFRGQSSLATYLTVVARRVVVRELLQRKPSQSLDSPSHPEVAGPTAQAEKRISDRDEVERLMRELSGSEAELVRLYHLENRSYEEISRQLGVPINSIGPMLSRARSKMRQAGVE